jgi:uncharacterized protein with HEPN domain
MTSERTYTDYLRDILDAVEKAGEFTHGIEFDQFAADPRTHFAVVRALEIIGEAAKNVPITIREQHPDIPWSEMARMRDKLIHSYFGVDLRVVWRTVQEDLPPLHEQMTRAMDDLATGETDNAT